MNSIPQPLLPALQPEAASPAILTGACNNIMAIAGVVLKELYRRKDFYVLFVLTALITLTMGAVSLFKQDHAARAIQELCLILIWVSSLVIAITATARQIPAEREQRTLLPLLAKPVTRHQVILGKFLGCWLACGAALLLFYVFFGAVAVAQDHEWPWGNYFQMLTLHWFMLGIVCAMTMLGSILFAAPSSNTTITLIVTVGILVVGRHLNKVALRLAEPAQSVIYAIYYALPHLEFFDVRDLVIHKFGLIAWPYWAGALGYAIAWMAFFLVWAGWLFRRRPVN